MRCWSHSTNRSAPSRPARQPCSTMEMLSWVAAGFPESLFPPQRTLSHRGKSSTTSKGGQLNKQLVFGCAGAVSTALAAAEERIESDAQSTDDSRQLPHRRKNLVVHRFADFVHAI